jgi:hypothetical protein
MARLRHLREFSVGEDVYRPGHSLKALQEKSHEPCDVGGWHVDRLRPPSAPSLRWFDG